jgi:cytochrome c-type biogenesis protein CcmH
MTTVAAVLVSAPLIRNSERRRVASDLAVYQDQLREVETEAAQGFIDPDQAESASMEIKRRILAADRPIETSSRALADSERSFSLVAVTGIVVLGSVGLYAATGRPELARAISGQATRAWVDSSRDRSAFVNPPVDSSAAQGELPSVDEMIQRLVARLQRNPKDAEGWRTLGWSYFSTERYDEAVEAYAKAVELNPTSAEYLSARSEAIIYAANGTVTAAARGAIEGALKIDPKNVRARYYLGLAKEQAGDKVAALKEWAEALGDADPAEPLLPNLRKHVAALGGNAGANAAFSKIATSPQAPRATLIEALRAQEQPQPSAPVAKGPTADDVRNAEAMTPSDRMAMIRSMVDGLAIRLEKSPRDVDGWIKLIRSRVVLGETDAAKQSLDRALKAFASDDVVERNRIIDAAHQLGINP